MFKVVSIAGGRVTAAVGDGMLVTYDESEVVPPWNKFIHHQPGPIYQYMNELIANAKRDWELKHSEAPHLLEKNEPHELPSQTRIWLKQERELALSGLDTPVQTPQEKIKEDWQNDLAERNQPPIEFS